MVALLLGNAVVVLGLNPSSPQIRSGSDLCRSGRTNMPDDSRQRHVLKFWVIGFRVLWFRVLGFRVLGFRVLGFRVLGFRV